MSRNELEDEKEKNREAKREWESDRAVMKEDISKLRDSLKHFTDMLEKMEGKHKVVTRQLGHSNNQSDSFTLCFC